MNPYVDGLPDGKGRLRAWWTSLGITGWNAAALVAIYLIVHTAWDPAGPPVALAIIAVAVALVFLARPGVRVTEASQPELARLIRQAATMTRLHEPARVWLTGDATVTGRYRLWWRELMIGRALLDTLTEAELRTLVTHELAIVHPGHTASRLAVRFEGERPPTSGPPVAVAVHERADEAAMAVPGPAVAARAMVVAGLAGDEYEYYLWSVRRPRHWWLWATAAISDLPDGWRRLLERGIPVTADDVIEDLAADHPGLASALSEVDGLAPRLGRVASGVRLRPLTGRQERRLARRGLRIPSWYLVRWHTFATAPRRWWIHRAAGRAQDVRRNVAAVLGRPVVDDLETAEVVLTRGDEVDRADLARTRFGRRVLARMQADQAEPAPPVPDAPCEPPEIVADLVEHALLPRGWRLEHPAMRGVLVGPTGTRIDALTLVTGTVAAPEVSALRPYLRTPAAGPEQAERARAGEAG